LSRIAGRTLLAEFSAFRLQAEIVEHAGPTLDPASRRLYNAFARQTTQQDFAAVFDRYPVLRRLIRNAVDDWCDYAVELVDRLARDMPAIQAALSPNAAPGRVSAVMADLSDPHRCGRTVARLRFTTGLGLVYKPRDVQLEAAVGQLVSWLNRKRPGSLRVPQVLDRDGYGWEESIDARPWTDDAECRQYYRRGGMLLCLAYVFGGGDLHRGNVVASAGFPIPVDLEVFLAASRAAVRGGGLTLSGEGARLGWDSVLRTGLLPAARPRRAAPAYLDGGLMHLLPPRSARQWRFLNSDGVSLGWATSSDRDEGQVEATDPLVHHPDEVVAGFADLYAVLVDHRRDLLTADGPMALFDGLSYRVVLRNTSTYALVIERATHPRALGSETERDSELRRFDAPGDSQPAAAIARAEREALDRLDVPIFWAKCHGTTVHTAAGDAVDGLIVEPGIAGAARRIRSLNGHDLQVQCHAIRLAIARADENRQAVHDHRDPATRARAFHQRAVAIAGRLVRAQFADADGSPTWVAVQVGSATTSGLAAAAWDLYGGRTGTALFLAAAGGAGDAAARQLSERVMAPLLKRSDDAWRATVQQDGLGAGTGVGGLVYALVRGAVWSQRDAWIQAATRAARSITIEAIDNDIQPDFIFGSAGALLGLLALYGTTRESWTLDLADRCGRRCRADARSLSASGVAHGRIGIAYALARLFDVTHEPALREVALDMWSAPHEHDLTLPNSWCRGKAGWALGRLACASLLKMPELLDGVDAAMDDLARDVVATSQPDHLCCGTLGQLSALSSAATLLNRPHWQAITDASLDRLLTAADQRAVFRLGTADDTFAPGLFQGLAGIGYELLRRAVPGMPTILLLE
jgi:type 2 lantibiotic biosynthesis protein LanM